MSREVKGSLLKHKKNIEKPQNIEDTTMIKFLGIRI